MTIFRTARRSLLPILNKSLQKSLKTWSMDSLHAEVYEVKGQIYRRNISLERMMQANSTQSAVNICRAVGMSDEEEEECQPVAGTSYDLEVIRQSVAVAPKISEEPVDKRAKGRQPEIAPKIEPLAMEKEECSTEKSEEEGMEPVELSIKYDPVGKRYQAELAIDSSQIGRVVGFKGSMRQKLEKSTGCKLKVDKRSGPIVLSADSEDSVRKCHQRIITLLVDVGRKPTPTHFVSVELSSERLRKTYTEFVEKLGTDEETSKHCSEKTLFRPVEKLHLTISVLRLETPDDIERVRKCVEELFQGDIKKVLGAKCALDLEFDGLDFFGQGPSKANVVYAKIVSSELQIIANLIDDALTKIGLAEKRRTEEVKLHLTLINTKNAKKGFKGRKINASALLKKFGDLEFDPVSVDEVRLCSMRGVDPVTNGYQAVFSMKFGSMESV